MSPEPDEPEKDVIGVPKTEGWPLVAAFGLSLLWAGMLTHWLVSALGGVCLVMALWHWFREVLPHEAHEVVVLEPEPATPVTERPRPEVGEKGHRARLPLRIYPYSAGLRGGVAGGIAMAILAILYGVLFQHSIWYPVNLLAAAGSASIASMTLEELRTFHAFGFGLAVVIHGIGSLLVGLLYGIALPMFPRRPILFGGVLAPLFWTGLLHSAMDIINPALDARIDWPWFVVAQVGFGVACGIVVARRERIYTLQHVPFAERMGVEKGGNDK
jgi:hypothetical protein